MNEETTLSTEEIWKQLDAEDGSPAPDRAVRQEPEVAPPQPEAKNDEPQDELPESVRNELVGLKTMVEQQAQRLRKAEGHIGGLNNQLRDAVAAAQQARSSGNEAPSAAELSAAQGDPEAMAKLKDEYPEFGELVDKAFRSQFGHLMKEIEALKSRNVTMPKPDIDVEARIEHVRREVEVEVRHPGWRTRVQEPQFVGWLQSQPREVQMLAMSDEPADAVRLLDLHSSASTTATATRTQRLNAAAAIPTGRGRAASAKPVEQMSPQEYWRYLDQLESQKG